MVPVISIVGKTNSGKTTLIEKIIPELKNRGYRVGTIKHDAHEFEIDREGKDSWRMTKAGADTVVIASSKKMGVVKKLDSEKSIDEITELLLKDVDIVITEGYKKQNKPKIEVTRSGELLCAESDNLVAVVDNTGSRCDFILSEGLIGIPCFDIGEWKKVVDMIEQMLLAAG